MIMLEKSRISVCESLSCFYSLLAEKKCKNVPRDNNKVYLDFDVKLRTHMKLLQTAAYTVS